MMGLSVIETIAAATSTFIAAAGRMPSDVPSVASMNENSPICASATATASATFGG
jgi:hypothetical protein